MAIAAFDAEDQIRWLSGDGSKTDQLSTSGGRLGSALALATGPDGLIYAAGDTDRVLRYDPANKSFVDVVVRADNGLKDIRGLAFRENGNLLVSSSGTNQVVEFDPSTGEQVAVAAEAGLDSPGGITVTDDGLLWVASQRNDAVVAYDADGDIRRAVRTEPGSGPTDVTLHDDGRLFVAAYLAGRVDVITIPTGEPGRQAATAEVEELITGLKQPADVSIGPDGALWVADYWSDEIQRFDVTTGNPLGSTVTNESADAFGPTSLAFIEHEAEPDVESGDTLDVEALADGVDASRKGFEINEGQFADQIDAALSLGGRRISLVDGSILVDSPGPDRGNVASLGLVGAKPDVAPQPTTTSETGAPTHYFIGENAIVGNRRHTQVAYEDLLPGVDMRYTAEDGGLTYDILLDPGVDPDTIRLESGGIGEASIDGQGRLVLRQPIGPKLRFSPPVSYQLDGDTRIPVESAYKVEADDTIGFVVGELDPRLPLVIDPTLDLSSYLGGTATDYLYDVAIDSSGNIVVVGESGSTDYPTTAGAYDPTLAANFDIVVSKLSADGTSLLWSTFIGGSSNDVGREIVIDGSDNIHLVGHTESSNYPTTVGAYQTTKAAQAETVVSSLSADGTTLSASTFIGGNGADRGESIGLTSTGDVVILTNASAAFPTTVGAYNQTHAGGVVDAAVSKLTGDLSTLTWSTFVGSSDSESTGMLDIDGSDNVWVVTSTDGTDMPVSAGAFDATSNGNSDYWVGSISADGSTLNYGTYLGGTGIDSGPSSLHVVDATEVHVATTASTGYPTTPGAYDTNNTGNNVGYVVLDTTATGTAQMTYGTFLGGTDGGWALDMTVDGNGRAYIVGDVAAAGLATVDAPDTTLNGARDAALAVMDPNTASKELFTYIGGSGSNELAYGVALNAANEPVVVGFTDSSDFATTTGAYQQTNGGGSDGFVQRYAAVTPPAAAANVVIVNSTDGDDTDANPGDDMCDTGQTNSAGDPECTLRAAIEEANASAAVDTINFNIPDSDPGHLYYADNATADSLGAPTATTLADAAITDFDPDYPVNPFSWWDISVTGALPTVTSTVTIDGTTQPGWQPNTATGAAARDAILPIVVGGTDWNLLTLDGSGSTVRGLNLIGGNTSSTVVTLGGTGGHTIDGSWVMMNITGDGIGRGDDGIYSAVGSDGNTIGGPNPADHVLIGNGYSNTGLYLRSNSNVVQNIWIGTHVSGTTDLVGNNDIPFYIVGNDNILGTPAAGIVVADSLNDIFIINGDRNIAQNGLYGYLPDGTSNDNEWGSVSGNDNMIGGVNPGEGNAFAGGDNSFKTALFVSGGTGNSVLGNTYTDSKAINLDIGPNGINANDAGDGDIGDNDLLNHPIVTNTVTAAGTTTIDYVLDVPAGNYRIEFYGDQTEPRNPDGYSAGELMVGATSITHTGSGVEAFQVAVPDIGPYWLSATATEDLGGGDYGSTSEFGPTGCVLDSDGDGICDTWEQYQGDTDGDTTLNENDTDDDNDTLLTSAENADPNGDNDPRDAVDSDWDGQPDYLDATYGPSGNTVGSEQKIASGVGGFTGPLSNANWFGYGVAGIGDFDFDGVNDMVVGARRQGTGGSVHVLTMNTDGTVKSEQQIGSGVGGLTTTLESLDDFGGAVTSLGDLDGDGITDIAVGASWDDDGGTDRGAVYILFLNPDGTVKSEQKISDLEGGLTAALGDATSFGSGLSLLGDLDGDGIQDLAVSAYAAEEASTNEGAVYILFLNPDGTVKAEQKISSQAGGLVEVPANSDFFGADVAGIGDLDGDGVEDLAVGATGDDDGGASHGAVYILFLNPDGTVKAQQKISDTAGGFTATLQDFDVFGEGLAGVGDIDGDGIADLVAGAPGDSVAGAIYVLNLNADGTVKAWAKINDTVGGFTGPLDSNAMFGDAVASLGDLDGNGTLDLAIGAWQDNADNSGSVYVVELAAGNTAPVLDNTGTMAFTAVGEDDYTNSGNTVAEVIASAGGDRITDADGDPEGIIWTDHNEGDDNGWWEFSTDGGTTWTRYGWYWNGLLLRDTDRIRFVPAGFDGETASITFRAWDQTDGAAGTVVRSPATGGSTAYSVANTTATITTTATNDAPVFGWPAQVGPAGTTDSVAVFDQGQFQALAENPDGSIVAVADAGADSIVVRYLPDGSLDPSFGDNGVTTWAGWDLLDVAVQSDGRLVVAGTTFSGTTDALIARLNADGTIDTSFGGGDGWTSFTNVRAGSVLIQADGDIVVAGRDGTTFMAARVLTDGTPDTGFGTAGIVSLPAIDRANNVVQQPDGSLLFASSGTDTMAVVRLTDTGALDTTFDGDGVAETNLGFTNALIWGNALALQADGSIVVTGRLWDYDQAAWQDELAHVAAARFTSTGTLDTTFGGTGYVANPVPGGSYWGDVESVALQPGGEIVLAGSFDLGYKGQNDTVLARYLPDGTLDTSFDGDGFKTPAASRYWDYLYDVIVAANGDIVAAGSANGNGIIMRTQTTGATVLTPPQSPLDGAPVYQIGGSPIVMDSDVAVYDRELVDTSSWTGTSLVITRQGGADANDQFSATGLLSALTEGQPLVLDGTTIGTVTTNSGGSLRLDFTASSNQTRVEETLELLAYHSLSAFSETLTLDWTFDDGTGATANGTVTVQGQTVEVNSTGDASDTNIGDDVCDTGNLNADGDPECTLRAAIQEANASATIGDIAFNIPATDTGYNAPGWWQIDLTTDLPNATDTLNLDGTTQPGYAGDPVIGLSRGTAYGSTQIFEVDTGAPDSVITGLAFGDATYALLIDGDRTTVTDSWFGFMPDESRADLQYPVRVAADDVVVGGPNRGNVIGNFFFYGVYLYNTGAVVQGNIVGEDPSGNQAHRGPDAGIRVRSSNVLIGGTGAGEGNRIAQLGVENEAVQVDSSVLAGVSILGNELVDNGLAIDLNDDGPTENDPGDSDSGPNELLNHPELAITSSTTADSITWDVDLDVTLDVPAGDYRIEVYANDGPGVAGRSEAQRLAHAFTVTHPGGGAQTFATSYSGMEPTLLGATATVDNGDGSYGSTSEYSLVNGASNLTFTVNSTGDTADNAVGDLVCDTGGTNSEGAAECTLRAAIEQANRTANATIEFNIPTSDPGYVAGQGWTIDVPTEFESLAAAMVVDGSSQPGWSGDPVIGLSNSGSVFQGLYLRASGVTVASLSITGFTSRQLWVYDSGVTVAGNWLGYQLDGTVNAAAYGVFVSSTNDTVVIGGSAAGDGNHIAGTTTGLHLGYGNDIVVQGNTIGVSPDGSPTPMPRGIQLTQSDRVLIGGTSPGEGNVVANTTTSAISMTGNNDDDVTVLGNTTFSNIIDIDLDGDGPTANDAGDGDIGINGLLNHPDITNIVSAAGMTTADYTLDVPAGDYRIEVFADLVEDQTLAGAHTITHTGTGGETFQISFPDTVAAAFRATATEDLGAGVYESTSEFSAEWAVCQDPDGDGLCSHYEALFGDTDGDTVDNHLDDDDDGDGILTAAESADPNGDNDPRDAVDADRDGQPDWLDAPTRRTTGLARTAQKISDLSGGLVAALADSDNFGSGVTAIGDLDGDGVTDIAVGAPYTDRTATNDGVVYILLMNPDGTVKAEQELSSATVPGLSLANWHNFGIDLAPLGDLNGDGRPELAVGTGSDTRVWILSLNPDGTAHPNPLAVDGSTDLPNPPTDVSEFGNSVAGLGDLNGDGVNDLLVGDMTADEGGWDYGAAHVVFLNADGTVLNNQVISDLSGGLNHVFLGNDAEFGSAVDAIGDIDGDGVTDIAVGSRRYGNGPELYQYGAVHILMLNTDGTVKAEQLITNDLGGIGAPLNDNAFFGNSVAGVGDLDTDGVPDLLVGGPDQEVDGVWAGVAYLLNLNTDGTVRNKAQIDHTNPALAGLLEEGDSFGEGVAGLGDLDGDGSIDLLVGAYGDDDGGNGRGAAYVIDMIPFITLNSTGDAGDNNPGDGACDTGGLNADGLPECTLRAAIEEANGVGSAFIEFEIPATDAGHNGGIWTISPAAGLPFVTGRIIIDGTSQPGWVDDPIVALDGSGIGVTTDGLTLSADYSTVTGLSVINWTGDGLSSSRSGLTFTGNWLGIAPDGSVAANQGTDLSLWGGAGTDNVVGGTEVGDGNLFAAAGAADGLYLRTSDVQVLNNIFGLAGDGVTSTGPPSNAIRLQDASTGIIINGNTFANTTGTAIDAAQSGTAVITNNTFGLDINGDLAPVGLALATTSSGAVSFGDTLGGGNTVVGTTGVAVLPNGTGTVTILGNSIAGSGALGIDLANDGVTTNDAGDIDAGVNGLLNFPVLSDAVESSGLVSMTVELDVPAGDYRLEVFNNPTGANPIGYGDGETIVFASTVTHAGAGPEQYSITANGLAGNLLTATATEDLGAGVYGATSEFSAAITVANSPDAILDRSIRRSNVRPTGGLDAVAGATTGVSGSALTFDGSTGRLVGPPLNVTSSALTVGARFQAASMTGTDYLVSKQTSGGTAVYELAVDGATSEAVVNVDIGGIAFTLRGGSITAGTWHDVVATWGASTLTLYVDGVQVDQTATSGTLLSDASTMVALGARASGTGGFDGLLDHVNIEHRVLSADEVAARYANTVAGALTVTVGQQQTGAPGAWTVSTAQARSGTSALAAPATSSGSAAWAVATGIDEPGVVFDSWWWVDSAAGLDLASGTRAGFTPTEQYDGAFVSADSWLLRRRYADATQTGATGTQALATGTWVNVEQWTDQNGNTRLYVDGVEVVPWTGLSSPPLSGSVGLRVGALPGGQSWLVDDPRARKLVMPEPVATLSSLDQN